MERMLTLMAIIVLQKFWNVCERSLQSQLIRGQRRAGDAEATGLFEVDA
jgi:hypothetical protein